ncbi:hypothetical protein PMIT1320_00550 [Prochlorococcus marinus str. MIT 1320]|nr:hypothetical protein PMIT1320_00550 [Prochlorococcus marinus str. MIT 1320]
MDQGDPEHLATVAKASRPGNIVFLVTVNLNNAVNPENCLSCNWNLG